MQAAWARIADQHDIAADPFKDLERIWSPTHLALVTPWAMSVRYAFQGLSVTCSLVSWLTHWNAQDGQSTEDGLARVCGHIRGCDENIRAFRRAEDDPTRSLPVQGGRKCNIPRVRSAVGGL